MDKEELILLKNALIINAYFEKAGGEDEEPIEDIAKKVMNTMDDLDMATEFLNRYALYEKEFDKSTELVENFTGDKKDIFKQISGKDTYLYDYLSRDGIYPSYFLTNFFSEDFLMFDVFNSQELKNPSIDFMKNIYRFGKVFLMFKDTGAKILDENAKPLCEAVLDKFGNMKLIDNKSKYDVFQPKGTNVAIYPRGYLESLKDESPDPENLIAILRWNYLNKDDDHGIIEVCLKETTEDVDLLCALSIIEYIHSFNR